MWLHDAVAATPLTALRLQVQNLRGSATPEQEVLVVEMARVTTNMRGPGMNPPSIACLTIPE